MAHFGSNELWVRYHQTEGFKVGIAECRSCHCCWYAAVDPGSDVSWKLECPNCKVHNNWFSELSSNRDI